MINGWLQNAHIALIAARCVVCGGATGRGRDLCTACDRDLPRIAYPCARCGLPLPAAASGPMCGECLANPPEFSAVVSAYAYAGPVRQLLHELKYRHKLHVARILGELMVRELGARAACADVIVPVPLHAARLRERGYNQALELARPTARTLGIPIDLASCVRVRHTAPQTDLPSAQRARNVRRAFMLKQPLHGKRVALIDDVMTTGATVGALAALLRKSGAADVQVWVCARALAASN